MARSPKYLFVIGGVISGVGKGTVTASLARLLSSKGYKVTAIKCDPYVNVDAGTMNPTEHGEVFVTHDGVETDQDVGTYERFLGTTLSRDNYLTTGQVYLSVINRERALEFKGKCVEVVPHIPLEVIRRIKAAQARASADITIIEIGGTVGEYQNLLFLEAARMMHLQARGDVAFILVSYLPIPSKLGEMKSKPTQYAVRTLNEAGIQPDFIVCRASVGLDRVRREKLSIFCNVEPDAVISAPDVDSVYQVPLNLEREHFGEKVLRTLGLSGTKGDLQIWRTHVRASERASGVVRVGIIGKYFGIGEFTLADSYISVIEALKHAAAQQKLKLDISWVDAESFEKNAPHLESLKEYDGVVVPGGFGERGVEGKIGAIRYVREQRIPFLGLCYGMQLATVEYARHVAKLRGAHTTEVSPQTPHPVIDLLPEQGEIIATKKYGGTMRLGTYSCAIEAHTKAYEAYTRWHTDRGAWLLARSRNKRASRAHHRKNQPVIVQERHRHRYELNNAYRKRLERAGLVISGSEKKLNLAEIIELPNHAWFVATQFHPEFHSRFLDPHPLFVGLLNAARQRQKARTPRAK